MTRVLIVDDTPESLKLLRVLLQGKGCEVDEARQGAEALVCARQNPPDLVISDILMPVMDGYMLLRHWRADERLRKIPFIVYGSTFNEPKDEQLAFDLGADAFILKPVEAGPLMARIREVLAKGQHDDLTPVPRPADEEEVLVSGRNQILEMIVNEMPLAETLVELVHVLESQSPGMLCSIVLLDDDGVHLRRCAAPSLPEAYNRAMDGRAIGERVGSCGTAAYRREKVIVEDIASDPLWADYRGIALSNGLRACWSAPIFDAARRVLGTFAIYYRQPRRPDTLHLSLIDAATHIAAIAINRARKADLLRESEQRFRALFAQSASAISLFEPIFASHGEVCDLRFIDVNPAHERMTGLKSERIIGKRALEVLPGMDQHWFDMITRVARTGEPEYYFDNYQTPLKRFFQGVIFMPQPGRIVSSSIDVTERKLAQQLQDALYQIAESAHSTASLPKLCGRIHEIVGGLLPARNFFIALYDEKRAELTYPYFVDELDPAPGPESLDLGTLSGEVIRTGEALLLTPEVQKMRRKQGKVLFGSEPLDWLGVPLKSRTGTLGVLVVQSYSGDVRYTDKDTTLLEYVSEHVAMAIERRRAEDELMLSEGRLRAIFDTEPECVKLLAADGSLLEMNPAGLQMIEADSFQQVENLCIYSIVVEEHRQAFKKLNENVFAGCSGTLEFQIVGLKGGKRWLETHVSPLRDVSGQITAALGVTRDITERRQAEANIRQQLDELRRWHQATLGREERLMELKREVNELLRGQGAPPRYASQDPPAITPA